MVDPRAPESRRHSYVRALVLACSGAALICGGALAAGRGGKSGGGNLGPTNQLPTTDADFFQRGTQPNGAGVPTTFQPLAPPEACISCHANYGTNDPFTVVEPYAAWVSSMMGQSGRDPLFYAGLSIANQDAAGAGQYCIRCHLPQGFLAGHSVPADGSALTPADLQSVHCSFCHRMVDPVYKPGVSPAQDQGILNDLSNAGLLTPQGNNARYTVDPVDVRRGPFNDVPLNLHPGTPQPEILHSPFHSKADFCWTCHGVSNPLMVRKPDRSYALGQLDAAHPTGLEEDMFPLHRTFDEWKNSYYSTLGIQHNGRFGGNHPTGIMKDCQDCHMPDMPGYGCNFQFPPFFERPNVPQHSFIGSNTWVLDAIRTVDADNDGKPDYPDTITGLNDDLVSAAVARNIDFLEKASDLDVVQIGQNIRARVHNRTGHKLPTGFPDGRRVWVNVKFVDCNEQQVQEYGAYDFFTATLDAASTKVYECQLGILGADYAASVGQPEGHTFHFVLANTVLKDNRIPPAGFSNSIALQHQTEPIGAVYENGQSWDDTMYPVPSNARKAVVTTYYQLTSREFIEYLRDANHTDNRGQVAYDLWLNNGMSQPVVMDSMEVQVYQRTDINRDGVVNIDDLLLVIGKWGACQSPPFPCPADVTGDGVVNIDDLLAVISAWGSC
jgi:hypothetical protein